MRASNQRWNQLVFTACFLVTCWLLMMCIHELGHVVGAVCTGGTVRHVELSPLAISRTDVEPNLHPGFVVWLGPVMGCLLPVVPVAFFRFRRSMGSILVRFFAGFSCIANGAYISVGTIDRVGDCGEMLRTGSHPAVMYTFGVAAILGGFALWHRLGSVREFVFNPPDIGIRAASIAVCVLVATIAAMQITTAYMW